MERMELSSPPSAGSLSLAGGDISIAGAILIRCNGLQLLRRSILARGAVPVPDHLDREDGIERETGDEAVQNQWVGDFLEGGEDAGEGAEEVVEDRKRAQLSSTTLFPNREDLRRLTRNTQHTRSSLQIAQHLQVHDILLKQRGTRNSKTSNPNRNTSLLPRILQHQTRNHHILRQNQRRLAVRRKREAMANIIAQANKVGAALKQVGQKADAGRRLRVEKLKELWDFDDRACANDADAQGFGDGEFEAVRGREGIDVEDEGLVAEGAEKGAAGVDNGVWQIVGYGLEGGAEGIHLDENC